MSSIGKFTGCDCGCAGCSRDVDGGEADGFEVDVEAETGEGELSVKGEGDINSGVTVN